MERKRKI
jgi:hypothetical protein